MGRGAAAAARAKRRRTKPAGLHPATAESPDPNPTEESHIQLQEPPPDAAGGSDGVDRISSLPDALLGEIISLLPTADGARTQVLASRWRHLWFSAPLNLDYRSLSAHYRAQLDIFSRILATHPGPVRRLSIPVYNFFKFSGQTTVAHKFDSLQELELDGAYICYQVAPRASAFRFSATLRVATIARCVIPNTAVENFHPFPRLGHLELQGVTISDNTLHRIIAGCPGLRYLLLNETFSGCNTIRINSHSLICIGFRYNNPYSPSKKLIIEDAPLLERLLQLPDCMGLQVSIISAPKLETLGCLTALDLQSELPWEYAVFQNLRAASFVEMCRIKVLAVDVNSPETMDMLFNFLRWFPCLEKLHIQLSSDRTYEPEGRRYLWRRDHLNEIKCLDSNLKTVVLKGYRGTTAHVKFVSLFILNVKRLEQMRIEAGGSINSKKCAAERRRLGQLFKKRASLAAQLCVTVRRCHEDITHVKRVYDLSKANPFDCTC